MWNYIWLAISILFFYDLCTRVLRKIFTHRRFPAVYNFFLHTCWGFRMSMVYGVEIGKISVFCNFLIVFKKKVSEWVSGTMGGGGTVWRHTDKLSACDIKAVNYLQKAWEKLLYKTTYSLKLYIFKQISLLLFCMMKATSLKFIENF
jgi:hypothetical protein